MFVARMVATTLMAGVRFEVVGFGGCVVLETRSGVKAVRVAALMNAGLPVTADVVFG
jgi:hypothetical protein